MTSFHDQFGPKQRNPPTNDEIAVEMAYAVDNGLTFAPSDRMREILEQQMDALQQRLAAPIGLPGRNKHATDAWDIELPKWTADNLPGILDRYDALPLECDGLTRVLHTVLDAYDIKHEVWDGQISIQREMVLVEPHMWIEIVLDAYRPEWGKDYPARYRIDYRARMWMPQFGDRVPHGLVKAENLIKDTTLYYDGTPVNIGVLSDEMFKVLTCPV